MWHNPSKWWPMYEMDQSYEQQTPPCFNHAPHRVLSRQKICFWSLKVIFKNIGIVDEGRAYRYVTLTSHDQPLFSLDTYWCKNLVLIKKIYNLCDCPFNRLLFHYLHRRRMITHSKPCIRLSAHLPTRAMASKCLLQSGPFVCSKVWHLNCLWYIWYTVTKSIFRCSFPLFITNVPLTSACSTCQREKV